MPFPLHFVFHSQPSTLKPRNHEEQNPNHKDKKKKKKKCGDNEGGGSDWTQVAKAPSEDDRVCWCFLSGSLDGFLDSCSWFSLGLWVRDSWCLLGLLRELVSCFLTLPTDVREWETERVWLRNWACKARFQFKWNRVQLTWFQHSKIEYVALKMLVS